MSRLIDADALLEGREDHEMISTHLIWNAPTIHAVEVVRCEDCQWYDTTHPCGTIFPNSFFCKFYRTFNPQSHFCASGIRRRTDAIS